MQGKYASYLNVYSPSLLIGCARVSCAGSRTGKLECLVFFTFLTRSFGYVQTETSLSISEISTFQNYLVLPRSPSIIILIMRRSCPYKVDQAPSSPQAMQTYKVQWLQNRQAPTMADTLSKIGRSTKKIIFLTYVFCLDNSSAISRVLCEK